MRFTMLKPVISITILFLLLISSLSVIEVKAIDVGGGGGGVVIDFHPGWNVFSTPALLSDISFSDPNAELVFYKYEGGDWVDAIAPTIDTIVPLDGFLVKNLGNTTVSMFLEYKETEPKDIFHEKTLSEGWNIIGTVHSDYLYEDVVRGDSLFNNISDNVFGDVVDFTEAAFEDYLGENAYTFVTTNKSEYFNSTFFGQRKSYAVYIKEDGVKYAATQMHVGTTEPGPMTFRDVPPSHWAYEYIESLVQYAVIPPADYYYPSSLINRADFTFMLVESTTGLIEDIPDTPTYTDVPKESKYYPYIETAHALAMIRGYRDAQGNLTGEFGLEDNVTRALSAKLLSNSFGFPSPPECATIPFIDVLESDWFYPYVFSAYWNNVMWGDIDASGNYNGNFHPHAYISKAEAAKYFYASNSPSPMTCVVEPLGNLEIFLAQNFDYPSLYIPQNESNVVVLPLELTASGYTDVYLDQITLHRQGLGNYNDIVDVRIEGANSELLSNIASVTSNDEIILQFNDEGLLVKLGETLQIEVIASFDSENFNTTHRFVILNKEDIISSAQDVLGTYPLEGEIFQLIEVIEVNNFSSYISTVTDFTPESRIIPAGVANNSLLDFVLGANDSDIVVKEIIAYNVVDDGQEVSAIDNSSDTRIKKFDLFYKDSYSAGSTKIDEAFSNNGRVAFTLNQSLTIEKNNILKFIILGETYPVTSIGHTGRNIKLLLSSLRLVNANTGNSVSGFYVDDESELVEESNAICMDIDNDGAFDTSGEANIAVSPLNNDGLIVIDDNVTYVPAAGALIRSYDATATPQCVIANTTRVAGQASGEGVTVKKTVPRITYLHPGTSMTYGSDKQFFKFITSSSNGTMDLARFTMIIDLTGVAIKNDIQVYDVEDENNPIPVAISINANPDVDDIYTPYLDADGNEVNDPTDGADADDYNQRTQDGADKGWSGTIHAQITFDIPEAVQEKTYVIQGTFRNNYNNINGYETETDGDSVSTKFVTYEDPVIAGGQNIDTYMNLTSTNIHTMIWSDRAQTGHTDSSVNTGDWTNNRRLDISSKTVDIK